MMASNSRYGDGSSPGKIFIGGLPKDLTDDVFYNHFGEYGAITDSVIMKDRHSGQPRGFGFITFEDPSVVDKVIEDTHVFNGKQVEIKRTIPKGAAQSKDFKTKKIFIGGIPTTFTEDELKNFFSKYGAVVEHQIIRDHGTNRSRGFGFVIFESEDVVDELLSKGNMIDMAGTKVEIKKAEPKKPSNPSQPPALNSKYRARPYDDDFGGLRSSHDSFDRGVGPDLYRSPVGRFGTYSEYGSAASDFGSYRSYGNSTLGGYRGESSFGYPSRFGNYNAGGYPGSNLGGYGRGEGYGYEGAGYRGAYESGPGASFSGSVGPYGRGGFSAGSRYHPYSR